MAISNETREDFMQSIYDMFSDDGSNDRANQIIDMFDIATENCIELPCKVGNAVYETVFNRDKTFSHINTHKVVGIHLGDFPDLRGHKRQEYLVTHCKMMNLLGRIPLNKLGKTVFLTKEEAEKALGEREKK